MPVNNTPLGAVEAVPYPGRVLKVGVSAAETVKILQHRLNAVGCGPIAEDGVFDKANTERAVKLFQTRFSDVTGSPLVSDGIVGSLTWGALFGASTVPFNSVAPSPLTKAAIDFALTQLDVRENPLGSNRGPEVDACWPNRQNARRKQLRPPPPKLLRQAPGAREHVSRWAQRCW